MRLDGQAAESLEPDEPMPMVFSSVQVQHCSYFRVSDKHYWLVFNTTFLEKDNTNVK